MNITFNQSDIDQMTASFKNRLSEAVKDFPWQGVGLEAIQAWAREKNIDVPELLEATLKKIGTGQKALGSLCPKCQSSLKYQGDRKRKVQFSPSVTSEVRRAYYTCTNKDCAHTEYPLDHILNLSRGRANAMFKHMICFYQLKCLMTGFESS